MKTLVVLLVMFTVTSISQTVAAQDTAAMKKTKSVAVTFDSAQANAKRPLTQAERLRRDATLRSNRRLQAGYNQPIPF